MKITSDKPSSGLADVLGHPARRAIVRLLNARGATLSPREMAESIDRTLPCLGFHARVLCEAGLIREAGTRENRGATERFYAVAQPRGA